MTIYDFSDAIGKNLIITRYCNQGNRFSAHFEYCEVKDGSILRSEYGHGDTPTEAINDYKNKIVGKALVFSAMSPRCQVYRAPTMDDVQA